MQETILWECTLHTQVARAGFSYLSASMTTTHKAKVLLEKTTVMAAQMLPRTHVVMSNTKYKRVSEAWDGVKQTNAHSLIAPVAVCGGKLAHGKVLLTVAYQVGGCWMADVTC